MALLGIYNSSDREIVLTPFQAQIFNQTIQYFKNNGVGGDKVFEDTYVLQKRVVEYIKENVTTAGGPPASFVRLVYNGVLGITPVAPPPPPPPSGGSPAGRGFVSGGSPSGGGFVSGGGVVSGGGSPSGGGVVSGGGSPSGGGVVSGGGSPSGVGAPAVTGLVQTLTNLQDLLG